MNLYLFEAQRAAAAYRNRTTYRDFPAPGSKGYCARAARALWTAVHGKPFPYGGRDADHDGDVDANDQLRLIRKAGLAIQGTESANAYHTAVAKGALRVGSLLYLPFAGFGHVVTVVAIEGDPAHALANVRVFENTSGLRGGQGPGTIITTLDRVCGGQGADRIVAVANVGA